MFEKGSYLLTRRLIVFAVGPVLSLGAAGMWAQASNDAGCAVERNLATCNWTGFRKALNTAQTVKVEYRERDRSTGSQLREMVAKLGKTVARGEDKPDLTVSVIPADTTGIDVSSADKEILELHIYAGDSGVQNLIWVETYVGQKDRPWPANVHATISQFLDRLKKG
jgi:hypothetical protein